MHSRWVLFIMAAALVMVAALSFGHVAPAAGTVDRGIAFPSANLWIENALASMWVNTLLTLAVATLMVALNRTYNLLRTSTLLDASLFLLMSLATPMLAEGLNTGTMLALVLLACLFLLYSTYQSGYCRERIFLIFFMLSLATMTQYCYVVYIPVFIVGTAQMRIFNLKTLLATVMGLITPWFVLLGCCIVGFSELRFPDIAGAVASFSLAANFPLIVAVVVSAAMLVVGWCLNFPRMIAYNAHMRAYNGTLSVLSLVTLLALCFDFTNMAAYAPVAYMCAGFYIGRFFAATPSQRSYIPIITIFSLYTALLIWTLMH